MKFDFAESVARAFVDVVENPYHGVAMDEVKTMAEVIKAQLPKPPVTITLSRTHAEAIVKSWIGIHQPHPFQNYTEHLVYLLNQELNKNG